MKEGSSARGPAGLSDFPGWSPAFRAALDRLAIAAPRAPRGHTPGPIVSRELGRALEFADYRPYTPGDDPKLVDWRAYSRLDRLYLKLYREERARTIALLVDGSASLDWGDGDAHKGRFARQLAAALTWIALGHLERVQLFALRGDQAEPLSTPLGRSGAASLFHSLAAHEERGPLHLPNAIRDAIARLRGQGPIIVISDLLDPTWREGLHAVAARGQGGAIVQVLSPDEWQPPLGDEVELEDCESGELRHTRLGPMERDEYVRRLHRFVEEIAAGCNRFGLRHIALNTGDAFSEVVLHKLPAAGILR